MWVKIFLSIILSRFCHVNLVIFCLFGLSWFPLIIPVDSLRLVQYSRYLVTLPGCNSCSLVAYQIDCRLMLAYLLGFRIEKCFNIFRLKVSRYDRVPIPFCGFAGWIFNFNRTLRVLILSEWSREVLHITFKDLPIFIRVLPLARPWCLSYPFTRLLRPEPIIPTSWPTSGSLRHLLYFRLSKTTLQLSTMLLTMRDLHPTQQTLRWFWFYQRACVVRFPFLRLLLWVECLHFV